MKRRDGKQRIANALMSLSAGKPIDEVPISDLIQKAGVSRTTFYYHFESTRQVLEWMMDDFLVHYLGSISIPAGETAKELGGESQMDLERAVCRYIAGTKDQVHFFLREDNYREFCQRFSRHFRDYCKAHTIVQIFPDGHSEPLKQGVFYDYFVHMSCLQLFAVLECWAERNFSETEEDFIFIFNTLHTTQITFQGK